MIIYDLNQRWKSYLKIVNKVNVTKLVGLVGCVRTFHPKGLKFDLKGLPT